MKLVLSNFLQFSIILFGVRCSLLAATSVGEDSIVPRRDPLSSLPFRLGLARQDYRNWAGAIEVDDLWTVSPESPEDAVLIANWALSHGYKVRPRGFSHNWSPLVVSPDQKSDHRLLLLDTTAHLTDMQMEPPYAVRVQTGASLEILLSFLEDAGFGIGTHPAPGDVSVGGMLAIAAHGTGLPAPGSLDSFGSISNLVLKLTAVVWDPEASNFHLRTFQRSDPQTPALLTNLGRILITEVSLRVSPLRHLRCVSRVDVPATELFADPQNVVPGLSRTMDSFLEPGTGVEVILFPFTETPWLKVWSPAPRRPAESRLTSRPYNYPFSDLIPRSVSWLVERLTAGEWDVAPTMGRLALTLTTAALPPFSDLWARAKNVQLYIRPSTLRMGTSGYALITSRRNVQLVISQFFGFYQDLLQRYKLSGLYPINGPLEVRVTGLDDPKAVGIDEEGAEAPALSPIRPVPGRPDLDTAVWLDCLTFPSTPNASDFFKEIETFLFSKYPPELATVRVEWSKGWAYTEEGGWESMEIIRGEIPRSFGGAEWDYVVGVFNELDPSRVFTNPLLDKLFS